MNMDFFNVDFLSTAFFFFFFVKEKALENFSSGFNSFLERKNLKVPAIAKEMGLKTSSVYVWKSGRGFPDFQTLTKLLEMGMTIKEMFGAEIAERIKENELHNGAQNSKPLQKIIDEKNEEIKDLKKQIQELSRPAEIRLNYDDLAKAFLKASKLLGENKQGGR